MSSTEKSIGAITKEVLWARREVRRAQVLEKTLSKWRRESIALAQSLRVQESQDGLRPGKLQKILFHSVTVTPESFYQGLEK